MRCFRYYIGEIIKTETKSMRVLGKLHPALFLKALVLEVARSIVLFPVIYYSAGLKYAAYKVREHIARHERFFALKLSIQTLFKPAYGDNTPSGRLIGTGIRISLLIFRFLGFLTVFLILVLGFIFYGALPFLIIYGILAL